MPQDLSLSWVTQPIFAKASGPPDRYELLTRIPGQNPLAVWTAAQTQGPHAVAHLDQTVFDYAAHLRTPGLLHVNLWPDTLRAGPPPWEGWTHGQVQRVALELTEQQEWPLSLSGFFREWQQAGGEVWYDDWMPNHRLCAVPLDGIKLDRPLLDGIAASRPRQALVQAVIHRWQQAGRQIIAEGLETPEDIAWAQAAGCDGLQGFGLARPQAVPLTASLSAGSL